MTENMTRLRLGIIMALTLGLGYAAGDAGLGFVATMILGAGALFLAGPLDFDEGDPDRRFAEKHRVDRYIDPRHPSQWTEDDA